MKNSGISLITLVVMIIIMVILASIAIIGGTESVGEANNTKLTHEISRIKEAVSGKMLEVEENPSLGLPGISVDNVMDYIAFVEGLTNEELEDFSESLSERPAQYTSYYRIVDSVSASALGVASVDSDHYFIVDYYTGKVYGNLNMEAYNTAFNNIT